MLAAGADGLLVAEQVTGGIELIVGVSTDPVLGPVLIVGAGGVTAEAVRDVSRSVLPLTRSRAEHMLDRLRIAPLLAGWRGQPGADREAIVDMLMRVAELAASGEIIELDINPVLARPDGAVGLDALLRVAAVPALD
jgi:acyl-CoA synthetase (NDP forming)